VEVSEGARLVLKRKGFSMIGRRNFVVAGVPIHNFAMGRILA
jgi:hypothetical protein